MARSAGCATRVVLCDERQFTRLPHHLWCHCCRIEELLGDFECAELIASKDSVVLYLRETWVQKVLLGRVERRWNEIRIAPDKGYGIRDTSMGKPRDTGYWDTGYGIPG